MPFLRGSVSNLHRIAAGGCESRPHKGGSCPCWGGSGGRSNLCRCSPAGGGRGAGAEVESWARAGGSSHHLAQKGVKDKEASLSCTHCTLLLIVGVVVWVPGVAVGAQPLQQGVALAPALLLVPIVVMVGGPRPAHHQIHQVRSCVQYL